MSITEDISHFLMTCKTLFFLNKNKTMPSGSFLTAEQKQQIYYLCLHKQIDNNDIYDLLFALDPNAISFGYLERICTKLRKDVEFASTFLGKCGTRKGKAGRPRIFDPTDEQHLAVILNERCTRQLKDLSRLLFLMMDRETDEIPALCSVFRLLKNSRYSRKVKIQQISSFVLLLMCINVLGVTNLVESCQA